MNIFATKTGRAKAVEKGKAGYDNPRENIDPHIKSRVIDLNTIRLAQLPNVLSGAGANISLIWDGTIASGQTLSLIQIDATQHDAIQGNSRLYPIYIITDRDAADTGAGIAIRNKGKGDGMYINVLGKSDEQSGPTGIGIDVNNSDYNNRGFGIQVWDNSITNRGWSGATGLILRKRYNFDTDHYLCRVVGNKNSMIFQVSGATATNDLIVVEELSSGTNYFKITADGNVYIPNLKKIDGTTPAADGDNLKFEITTGRIYGG